MSRPARAARPSTILLLAFFFAVLASCPSLGAPSDPIATQALAPTGKLRVGLYPGTPTSIIGDVASADVKGVGFELGKALAQRAGVPFEPIVLPNNAAVFAAAKAGTVDMVFTNATPARMKELDFSPPVLQIEQGYLVVATSPMNVMTDIDRPGVRVGVSEGSTSEATLSRELRNASIVRASSIKAAIEMLGTGKIDAFATNKAILFEMSDQLPGSRVLPGRWGLESIAIGIPKGRASALSLLESFVSEVKANGLVTQAAQRAGVRGTVVPQ